jgi:sec-independent protein translocase protein TatA
MPFIGPWEIALIVIVVVLLFGAKRIPQLIRSIGDAVKQYRESSETNDFIKNDDEILIKTAKKLGIQTEGKTTEEISKEIMRKAKKR